MATVVWTVLLLFRVHGLCAAAVTRPRAMTKSCATEQMVKRLEPGKCRRSRGSAPAPHSSSQSSCEAWPPWSGSCCCASERMAYVWQLWHDQELRPRAMLVNR
eukprot:2516388-Pyramimonas_sp.AAC.1